MQIEIYWSDLTRSAKARLDILNPKNTNTDIITILELNEDMDYEELKADKEISLNKQYESYDN